MSVSLTRILHFQLGPNNSQLLQSLCLLLALFVALALVVLVVVVVVVFFFFFFFCLEERSRGQPNQGFTTSAPSPTPKQRAQPCLVGSGDGPQVSQDLLCFVVSNVCFGMFFSFCFVLFRFVGLICSMVIWLPLLLRFGRAGHL